jgi:hypothetical protein
MPLLTNANDNLLHDLKAKHPRLLVDATTWQKIKAQRENDPQLDKLLSTICGDAELLLTQPPLQRVMIGKRLLYTSRNVLTRVLTLSTAYQISHDSRYAKRAIDEMLSAANFQDWNPLHFLDAAEMTTALSIGYDWLYGELTPDQRKIISHAIVDKGFRPALRTESPYTWWQKNTNNWTQVCWGGLTLGALAIGDQAPEISNQILSIAKNNIQYGLQPYEPDGVYPEGPMYWTYGTTYQVLMIAALQSALGTDWGLSASKGFRESAEWHIRLTGPSGKFFNFSDCREEAGLDTALFWFACNYHEPGLLYFLQNQLNAALKDDQGRRNPVRLTEALRFLPLAAVWWQTPGSIPKFSKDALGNGTNLVAVFRSSWDSANGLYLALKGGYPRLNHAHMDCGSFVFELDGVRWALDLGMQEYNSLESIGVDMWGKDRWKVFRLGNQGHNTLSINNQTHNPEGKAAITDFQCGTTKSATVELSDVFKGQADRVTRQFTVINDTAIRIDDSIAGIKPGDCVSWRMFTAAKVEILSPRGETVLSQNGKSLHVKFSVKGGTFELTCVPAKGENDYDAPNPGVSVLILNVSASTNLVAIESSLFKNP